jgi:predicted DNA-binding transcriptional regulator AlpA
MEAHVTLTDTLLASAAAPPAAPLERLLRKRVVLDMCGGIRSETLWRWVRDGHFPEPVRLNASGSLLAWRETDVEQWIENRQRGPGASPYEAWAARRSNVDRRRRQATRFVGPTRIFGFVRRAPFR